MYSCHSVFMLVSVDSGRIHKKISADNLWLYKLIEKIEKNQAALEKLFSTCNKNCDDVPEEKVVNVINTLIEQEYFLTEIRIPAYCSNTLSYYLGAFERRNILSELREQPNQIQRRFDEYEEGYGQSVEKPLAQVLEPAGFDGLSYIGITRPEENENSRIFPDDIKIIEWLSYLFDENYIYTLEIEIEVIVVLTEAWRLTKKHFRIQNLD